MGKIMNGSKKTGLAPRPLIGQGLTTGGQKVGPVRSGRSDPKADGGNRGAAKRA